MKKENDAPKKTSARPIQSVERALDILEAVAAAGDLGGSAVSRAVGLHVATTHNLLRTLVMRNYLSNEDGRYRLGAGVMALLSRWSPVPALLAELNPACRRLVERTGEAASAVIMAGTVAKVLAFVGGTRPITVRTPQWEWPNALYLATGRILVAFGPEEQWEEFRRCSPDAEPSWSEKDWRRELRRIREDGVAYRREQPNDSQFAIACPIRTGTGGVVAALGLSAPSVRITPDYEKFLVTTLQYEAENVSRQLGWTGTGA